MAKKPAAPEQYQTEQRPIADVIPYERNPRVNDQAVDAVARSIQDYGFQQPIVVDSAGVVVVGHTRLKAAVKLGLETVPVHVATDLTPEQAKAYRLADNKTGELAIWDLDLLGVEITELDGLGVDVTGLGFDEIDLAGLLVDNPDAKPPVEGDGDGDLLTDDDQPKEPQSWLIVEFASKDQRKEFAKRHGLDEDKAHISVAEFAGAVGLDQKPQEAPEQE